MAAGAVVGTVAVVAALLNGAVSIGGTPFISLDPGQIAGAVAWLVGAAALAALPEAYAETLALRLVEGLTGPEISERTGLTPGSVRVNLHRGMALLREKLGLPPKEGSSDE